MYTIYYLLFILELKNMFSFSHIKANKKQIFQTL